MEKTYTLTITRKQYTVQWDDGIAHYPRTTKGSQAAARKLTRLQVAGYTEAEPKPTALDEVVAAARQGQ